MITNSMTSEKEYGLSWNPRPRMVPRYVILCAVLSGISIVTSWLAVITIPGGFLGIGALYFASVLYAIMTYWFGGWGLIASFIGAFVGSGIMTGMPVVFALPFAIADIIEPLIPFLLLRLMSQNFDLDPLGSNISARPRNLVLFIFFGALIPPLLSGIWGTLVLYFAGFVPAKAFWFAVASWWIGAAVLLAVFVPPICRAMAGTMRRTGLACKGLWS